MKSFSIIFPRPLLTHIAYTPLKIHDLSPRDRRSEINTGYVCSKLIESSFKNVRKIKICYVRKRN